MSDNSIDKELKRVLEMIKGARIRKNLSKSQLAKKLDMSSQNYGMIEAGNRILSYPLLLKIMKILEIESLEPDENNQPKYAIDNQTIVKLMNDVKDIKTETDKIKEQKEDNKKIIALIAKIIGSENIEQSGNNKQIEI